MKRLLVATLALLVITPALAAAQTRPQPAPNSNPTATKPAPRLRAFVEPGTPNLDTIKGQADAFRRCDEDGSPLRLTCKMLVDAFNVNPAYDELEDVENKDQLADLIESEMEIRECPATSEKVPIAAVRGDKIVYLLRNFHPKEQCLVIRRTNQVFSAATCTQFVGVKLAAFTKNTDSPVGAADGDPGLTDLRKSIDDITRRVGQPGDGSSRQRSQRQGNPSEQSWIGKNWKWVAPLSAGVVLGALFGGSRNENVNKNCNGTRCTP